MIPDRDPDWVEVYSGVPNRRFETARAAFLHSVATAPGWLSVMMRVRAGVARLTGQKAVDAGEGLAAVAALPVVEDVADRSVVGQENGPLVHSLETELGPSRVSMTNRIWFTGTAGRLYLYAILPGHILAMRHMMSRIATNVSRNRPRTPAAPR